MQILVDQGVDAQGNIQWRQWLHTDLSPINMTLNPTGTGLMITHLAFLQLLNGNLALQHQCGYDIVNKLPGEPVAISRWQRIVNASKTMLAEPGLTALNLA